MNFRYWRGRVLLRLAKLLDRWAWRATERAKRDLGASAMPDDDLFSRRP
jgi:hypothetical protein